MFFKSRSKTVFIKLLTFSFPAMLSCATTPGSSETSYPRRIVPIAARPNLHGVHSERLEQAMAEFGRLSLDSDPRRTQNAADRDRRIREIADAASLVASTSQHIPEVLTEVRMADAERQRFVQLAEALHGQAMELHVQAGKGDLRQMETGLAKLNQTCNQCHTAFRVLPVVARSAD